MFKKLAIIGIATALVGCGTTNRVLADASIFTNQNPVDYTKIFNERTAIMGILALMKEKPYVAPVNKTPVFFNHTKSDAKLDTVISQFPHNAFDVYIKSPRYFPSNRSCNPKGI